MTDIKRYILPFSVTGNEEKLASIIAEDMKSYSDTQTIDPMGNLICFKKGKDSSKKLMLCGHMDEIGFVVTFIDEKGYIRVSNVGGIRAIPSSYGEVTFKNGTKGIIVLDESVKPDDISAKSLIIDIGAANRKEAEKHVKIGDFCALTQNITRLFNHRYAAKAFDDRIGCSIIAEAAKRVSEVKYDTYYVFSVQEEVGCRGSKAATNSILPDFAVACDVTPTNDSLGAKNGTTKLGGGAAIKVKDASVICSKKLVDRLTELAEENKIKYQYEILVAGGTDTSSMQIAGCGSYAGCISLPTRYVHSPVETIDTRDVENCVELFKAFIEKGM